ncbi:DNA recombination protein RmuC [Dermacoccaceae bacterium W4C1]
MEFLIWLVCGIALGAAVTWAWSRQVQAAHVAGVRAERDLLKERVIDLETSVSEDAQTAALLGPLAEALGRVEHHVGALERDRLEQFTRVDARLVDVAGQTTSLRQQTAALVGALNSSTTRGAWGEVQLRRVLEHSGMLAQCDFDQQVSAISAHEAQVRPDVVVHLPGDRVVVLDAKAPMTAFLEAVGDGVDQPQRAALLAKHARQLQAHVEGLSAKAYWSAFSSSPEFVVCFVPTDAMLSEALRQNPALLERAMSRKVVLASPSSLLAVLRSVAFAWQQDALAANARELLTLGQELYARLGTLGGHVSSMGRSLNRTVEQYNSMVGTLENRVLVSARKMRDLGVASDGLPSPAPVEQPSRPLTSAELIDAEFSESLPARDDLDLGLNTEQVRGEGQARDAG